MVWKYLYPVRSWKISASMKTILAIIFACFCFTKANAAGVTIITHGYELDGEYPTWVTAMADEIPNYYQLPVTNFTTYKITLTTDGSNYYYQWQRTNGSPPTVTDTGEIIVELDWSQMDGGPLEFDNYDLSTSIVAPILSDVILRTNIISELNGHALAEYPIHLIGHSRGGSLMNEVSRILGTNGVWVDHLTTLDPHPLNNDGNFDLGYPTDASAANTYANVLFHDNFYQETGLGAAFGEPDGEPTAGAYNRLLSGVEIDGGYGNYHSNVHLWYHGTVELNTPANDTGATITSTERTNWWYNSEDEGVISGFYYSLIGGGDRTSYLPLGLPADPMIRDGYNQSWNIDLGAGFSNNRTSLPSNSGTWPNIIKFFLTGTNTVLAGQQIATEFYYQYGGASNNVTAQIYFDRDLNPYNTNSTLAIQGSLTNTGVLSIHPVTASLNSTNIRAGVYAVYAKMTDGIHTRYLYLPQFVTIISNLQPPTLDIQKSGVAQFIIGINGVPGQKIILQTSSSLQSWTPLATNTLTTIRWTYTNNLSANVQFYRAVLSP